MKRWEIAKREGMNWQSILVADAESDIKELVRDCVLTGQSLAEVNQKVMKLINETVTGLDSDVLKSKVKQSFPKFASKMYIKWVALAGTYAMGMALVTALKAAKQPIPPKFEEVTKGLPKEAERVIFSHATANADYPLEYERSIARRIDDIASTHATDDGNPYYTLRAGVERELRWEWQQDQIQKMRDSGAKLVWINSHANCSKRCEPWQGRLYSLDGTSGTIDGISYIPIETATDIYEYTKSGTAYKNGILSGFNCRHTMTPYRKGYKPPVVPESVMKHQRKVEFRQREMERKVRYYEDRLQASPKGTKIYKHNKELVKKWTEEYKQYSLSNEVPYYPSRLKI